MADKTAIEWTDATLFGEPLPRRCRGCGLVKPMAEFNVDQSRPDGRGYVCRGCRRTSSVDLPNRVERATTRKQGLAWCRVCADWRSAGEMTRRGLCREHQREEDRRRYREDADFRERRVAHSVRRKRGVEPVPHEGKEALLELYDGRCAYCGGAAEAWDHVVPVAKGGQTTPDNILPSCVVCNSSKRDRDLDEWLDATGRTLCERAIDQLSHFQVLNG